LPLILIKVNSNNLEIEERNLKSLVQKVTLKLLDVGYLISNYSRELMRLFEWLEDRCQPILQGYNGGCSMSAIA
jgi:hypothetical protein